MFARLTGMIAAALLTLGAAQAEVGRRRAARRALDRGHVSSTLREDLAEATANGQRLMVMIEQRGCIYCSRMHEEVWVVPDILQMLEEEFYVVRINMHGSTEVTDFDGETMEEREIARALAQHVHPHDPVLPRGGAGGNDRNRGRGGGHARRLRPLDHLQHAELGAAGRL